MKKQTDEQSGILLLDSLLTGSILAPFTTVLMKAYSRKGIISLGETKKRIKVYGKTL